jgi:hypothetical protein
VAIVDEGGVMATSSSEQTVVLTREQRDGLRDFLMGYMCADLEAYERRQDWAAIRATSVSLTRGIPIVDQLGWDEQGDRDEYPLAVDETLRRVAGELRLEIESTIRDGGPRALARDLAALAAVALIEAVV